MQEILSKGSMRFRVLGPLEVDVGDVPIRLGGPKQRAVLAHLVLRANQLVPAETLVDEIWGEEPPEKARNVIQTYVSHLRKALGPDRIQSHGPGYRLRLDPSMFEALPRAKAMGYDDRGNRKVLVMIGDVRLTVVIDEAAEVVVTIWAE